MKFLAIPKRNPLIMKNQAAVVVVTRVMTKKIDQILRIKSSLSMKIKATSQIRVPPRFWETKELVLRIVTWLIMKKKNHWELKTKTGNLRLSFLQPTSSIKDQANLKKSHQPKEKPLYMTKHLRLSLYQCLN